MIDLEVIMAYFDWLWLIMLEQGKKWLTNF